MLCKNTEADVRKCSVKNILFKISPTSQENTCNQSLFLNKVGGWELQVDLKRGSDTFVFLWIVRKFEGHLFYGTPPESCFWKWMFFKISVLMSNWLYGPNTWKISVKKFNENGTLSQAYFHWFNTDVEQLFSRRSPSGCF